MTRERLVLRHAELIEREMKRVGVWRDEPAPADLGEEAFGADALAFEQWLQHVFLARVREACAAGSLPKTSEVGKRAFREWVMHGPDDPALEALIDLLHEIDDLVSFHPVVRRVGFFETGKGATSQFGRALTDRFDHAATRYVAWQLEVAFERPARPLEVVLGWRYVLEDGRVAGSGELRTIVQPDWRDSFHYASWGFEDVARWTKGRHELELSLWEAPLTRAPFTIA